MGSSRRAMRGERPIRIIDIMIPDLLAFLAAVLGAAGLVVLVVGGAAAAMLDEVA